MSAVAGNGSQAIFWHQFEDLLNCMICFESFRNPKMLMCGHTFCAECLIGYQRTYEQQRRAVPGKLPCPTCRELTALPAGGVVGLRNDFKVQKMEDLFRSMNFKQRQQQQQQQPVASTASSRSSNTDVCAPCHTQNKTAKATVHCSNCSMFYCDVCLGKHNRNALFNNHKVTSVQGSNNGLSDVLYCKKHAGEQGKFICQTCEMIVCTACIVIEHADHDVTEMTSVLRQQQQDMSNLQSVVQSKNDELKLRIMEIERLRQANKASCERGETAIKEKSKQTLEAVRQAETRLISELRTTTNDRLAALDRELDRIKYNISRTQVTGDYARSLTGQQTSVKMIALHDELVQRMRTVVDSDSAGDVELLQTVVSFRPGRNEPIDLGTIELARMEDQLPVVVQRKTSNDRASVQPSGITPAAISRTPPPAVVTSVPPAGVKTSGVAAITSPVSVPQNRSKQMVVHVNGYGDRPGEMKDPLSVACLLNGELVVSEWGNNRLQVFSADGRSIRLIAPGQIGPQGVALTLKGNMIATDVLQKRMQVFDPSGNSISKWGIGKFFNPCGVAISPNGNCVVSDTGDHSVSVYRGETACVARFGSLGPRDDQLDNPLYVTTGLNNEIFVSDSNNHCVKIFSSKGNFVRKVGSEGTAAGNLKFPRGVCIDQQGNIIVADRNNDRVCMFSGDGRFIRHLLTKDDGVKAPYAVGITIAGQLVITESGTSRAALKVFRL